MYKIYADETLIYDSTSEDYKIGKGLVELEVDKSGSFVFSVYPGHPFYDRFVRLKTVITVYRFGRIVFRGRILSDETNYWNNKVLTCEGELGFLQDSIIRPFTFEGAPYALFEKLINEHNAQTNDFKKFRVGATTVTDPNGFIDRSNSAYETAYSNLHSRLIESTLGGHFVIYHGDNGTDPTPTISYLADFVLDASQVVEFGANLRDCSKTVKAADIATAIIPLGAEVDDGGDNAEKPRLTIASVNDGIEYIYDPEAVAERGWIVKVVEWDDVTEPANLKTKAEAYLKESINPIVTLELNAIDLRLLDKNVESFHVGDNVRVVSQPHGLDTTMLCSKQTFDLLNPENDTLVLGKTLSNFTETAGNKDLYKLISKLNKLDQQTQANDKQIEDILYEVIDINSFTNNVGAGFSNQTAVEIGATIEEVEFKWALNKTPKSLALDGKAQPVDATGAKLTGLSITEDTTWELLATDERDAEARRSASVKFLPGIYYGVGAYTSPMLLTMEMWRYSHKLQNKRDMEFTVDCKSGYKIICYIPVSLGTPSFSVNGFSGGFEKVIANYDIRNSSGAYLKYDIWSSTQHGLGLTTVTIK